MRNPVSRFAYTQADLDVGRSIFDRTHDHKTTMSAGHLYPILVDEVYPGDTYSIDLASLIRMSTPIHPVLDNAYLDVFFFFTPYRIVWDHWKELMGESPQDPYLNSIEYSVPMLKGTEEVSGSVEASIVPPKSILDYMGIPSGTTLKEISQLPVRAYVKVWNEWFRDQNLQNAADLDTGDSNYRMSSTTVPGTWNNNNKTNPDAYVNNAKLGGDLCPVNKYHDYFTSALKEPQKGNPVPIPLSGFAPVYANNAIKLNGKGDNINISNEVGTALSGALAVQAGTAIASNQNIAPSDYIRFNNLGADLSDLVGTYATINDLRYAFQLQKFLEADNRGGSRYREILRQHFFVSSPDASQQVPEFLGGKRIPINISQVLQTSSTDTTSPQGNTAAYSLTSDKFSAFTKSFTEHGVLLALACIRTEHTYAQGVECMWSRKNKFDFYFPEFSSVSEQPIYNRELYNGAYSSANFELADKVFGYKEPWAELKYKPNRVSGEFRPTYEQSLDVWHYADDYASQPYLSSEWIRETRANIDRTLAVSSDVADQFICDFYFKMRTTRVMPLYSIPGLADHH